MLTPVNAVLEDGCDIFVEFLVFGIRRSAARMYESKAIEEVQ